ncbi:MAG: hypothetical protein MI923_18720 [Phycisphaerales bacterium]|nr:hypothetical protein [Phycisphaerales bacterium]
MKSKVLFFVLLASTFGMSDMNCPNIGTIAIGGSECPEGLSNPAVDRIDFRRVDGTLDMVRITGVVENKGSGDFSSGEGQQTIQLYEGVELVAQQAFENLAAGATASISHTRTWETGNEFAPTYRVLIVYDPDIYIDANADNDDCQPSDNALARDGVEIDDLFTPTAN